MARPKRKFIAMKSASLWYSLVSFANFAGSDLLTDIAEPVQMFVWGFALLLLGTGAKALLIRSKSVQPAQDAGLVTVGIARP